MAGGDYANEIISVNGISNNILNPLGEERDLLRDMYTSVASHMGLVDSTTASINTLDAIETLPPNTNPNYQTDNLSSHLNDIARIIKSNTAPPFMTVNFTSWDYHANLRSRMDAKIQDLNDALGVFYHDLKDSGKLDSTCVLVMSEFGRTLDRNKDVGLDHGNGSVMFVMGGGISAGKGGQVVADWPGLPIPDYVTEPGKTKAIVDPAYPNAVEYTSSSESRLQLRATTHYTQVYRDILEDFHGITNANDVFGYDPGYSKLNLFSS